MITFEVFRNGKRVCVAGAEDLAVLSTVISAVGKLGQKTVRSGSDATTKEIYYSVQGLTGRPNPDKDVHLRWKSVAPLRVGDVLQVKVNKLTPANADFVLRLTRSHDDLLGSYNPAARAIRRRILFLPMTMSANALVRPSRGVNQ